MYTHVVCVRGVYIYVWRGIHGAYTCACVVCICVYTCVMSMCGVNVVCLGVWDV